MYMNEKDAQDILEMLYPLFIKKYKQDASFNKTAQVISATIDSVLSDFNKYLVKINPYDTQTIPMYPVNASDIFAKGDQVFVMYWGDLTNGKILCKNK